MQHLFGNHVELALKLIRGHKSVEGATSLALGQIHFMPFVEVGGPHRTGDLCPWSSSEGRCLPGFAGIAVSGPPESTPFPLFPCSLLGLRAHSSGNRAGRLPAQANLAHSSGGSRLITD